LIIAGTGGLITAGTGGMGLAIPFEILLVSPDRGRIDDQGIIFSDALGEGKGDHSVS